MIDGHKQYPHSGQTCQLCECDSAGRNTKSITAIISMRFAFTLIAGSQILVSTPSTVPVQHHPLTHTLCRLYNLNVNHVFIVLFSLFWGIWIKSFSSSTVIIFFTYNLVSPFFQLAMKNNFSTCCCCLVQPDAGEFLMVFSFLASPSTTLLIPTKSSGRPCCPFVSSVPYIYTSAAISLLLLAIKDCVFVSCAMQVPSFCSVLLPA